MTLLEPRIRANHVFTTNYQNAHELTEAMARRWIVLVANVAHTAVAACRRVGAGRMVRTVERVGRALIDI